MMRFVLRLGARVIQFRTGGVVSCLSGLEGLLYLPCWLPGLLAFAWFRSLFGGFTLWAFTSPVLYPLHTEGISRALII